MVVDTVLPHDLCASYPQEHFSTQFSLVHNKQSSDDVLSQRCNLFLVSCTIGNAICSLIIDSRLQEYLITIELVEQLHLQTEHFANKFELNWLSSIGKFTKCKVKFIIGDHYTNTVTFSVVFMTICHLLLGWTCQWAWLTTHDGCLNTYILVLKVSLMFFILCLQFDDLHLYSIWQPFG